MEPSIVIALIGLLSAPVAAVVGFRLNKKKSDTDISNSIANASGDAVEAIRVVMHELQEELRETKRELQEFKKQNRELEAGLGQLNKQNETLMNQNNKLADEIVELRKQIDRL